MLQHKALKSVVTNVTTAVNTHGDTETERLLDTRMRIREVALHGVREGAAHALAAAQLWDRADLSERLTPHFIDERHHDDYDDLVETFAPLGDAVSGTTVAEDVVNKVFLSP